MLQVENLMNFVYFYSTIMKRSIPFILLAILIHLLACGTKPHSNYTKLSSFFKENKQVTSTFIFHCKGCYSNYNDTMFVTETVTLENKNIRYSILNGHDFFELLVSPEMVEVTADSNSITISLKLKKYQRKIEDVFIEPDYKNAKGNYKAINNPKAKDPSLGFKSYYLFRVYFTIENEDLVIHKDFALITDKYLSYYISKTKGLYKIVLQNSAWQQEYMKQ